ncbi:hypothetical protein WME98_27995 [Sorangium sp. So ce296]|uniref:hypothetical protein n=1 Tax=Sorangium sp. So ce296 TaxID=3133296 RepID=UPI003F5E7EFA
MEALCVTMRGRCQYCQAMLPINRVDTKIFCSGCGTFTEIANRVWHRMLREPLYRAPRLLPGEVQRVQEMSLSLEFSRSKPACRSCRTPLAVDSSALTPLSCSSCGAQHARRRWPADIPIAGLDPEAVLVGEEAELAPPDERPDAPGLDPSPCALCGGARDSSAPAEGCERCAAAPHVPETSSRRPRDRAPITWLIASERFAPISGHAAPVQEGLFDWREAPRVAPLDDGGFVLLSLSSGEWTGPRRSLDEVHERVVMALDPDLRVRWLRRERVPGRLGKQALGLASDGERIVLYSSREGHEVLDGRTGASLGKHATSDAMIASLHGREARVLGLHLRIDRGRLAVVHGDAAALPGAVLGRRGVKVVRRLPGGGLGVLSRHRGVRLDVVDPRGGLRTFLVNPKDGSLDGLSFSVSRSGLVGVLNHRRLWVARPGDEELRTCLDGPADRVWRDSVLLAADDGVWLFENGSGARRYAPDGALLFDAEICPRPKARAPAQLASESTQKRMERARRHRLSRAGKAEHELGEGTRSEAARQAKWPLRALAWLLGRTTLLALGLALGSSGALGG